VLVRKIILAFAIFLNSTSRPQKKVHQPNTEHLVLSNASQQIPLVNWSANWPWDETYCLCNISSCIWWQIHQHCN